MLEKLSMISWGESMHLPYKDHRQIGTDFCLQDLSEKVESIALQGQVCTYSPGCRVMHATPKTLANPEQWTLAKTNYVNGFTW